MATGIYSKNRTGNPYVDGVMSGWHWNSNTISYGFPQEATAYGDPSLYGYGEPIHHFSSVSASMRLAFEGFIHGTNSTGTPWMTLTPIEGFANVTLTETPDPQLSNTDVLIASSSDPGTAYCYYPATVWYPEEAGDVWFGLGNDLKYKNPLVGSYGFKAAMHEFGHSLGLKHGHDIDMIEDVAVPLDKDFLEYTLMTYNYVPEVTPGFSIASSEPAAEYESFGFDFPQTYMMLDIAGFQAIYGANYSFRNTDTVYSWSPMTGEAFVNGVAQGAPGSNVATGPATNRILETIWDGGGSDTYDLSAYSEALSINLAPGAYSTFSQAQRALLGYKYPENYYARGNVYNSLLHEGDLRSIIENAKGGSSNDTIKGNDVRNHLWGQGGDDVLEGRLGNDALDGGAGADTAVFAGAFSEYAIQHNADGSVSIVDSHAGRDGEDLLTSIRFARFADTTIILADNNAPHSLSLSNSWVAENMSRGFAIGVLAATDPDGDRLTYSLSQNPGGYFKIDGDKLVLDRGLDYETLSQISVVVKASDVGGLFAEETFKIDVLDVVERPNAPPSLTFSGSHIAEDVPVGTVVGILSSVDPDGDAVSYSLLFDASGYFALDGNKLVVAKALDYETLRQHTVVVSASDGRLSTTNAFSIDIDDVDDTPVVPVNHAPESVALSGSYAAEDVPVGTVVGTLSSVDPDGDAVSYSLLFDSNGYFALDGNKLVVAKALDYETLRQHTVVVSASDGRLSTTSAFSIDIGDVDDTPVVPVNHAPVSVALSGLHAAEDVPVGTVVGTLSSVDPDGDAVSYSLSFDASGYFTLDGNKLVVAKTLDYETLRQHTVVVSASDGHLTTTQAFSIDIDNVNDTPIPGNRAPEGVVFSASRVAEDVPVGTVVGRLFSSDPDDDAVSYSLLFDAYGHFAIEGNKLVVKKALDYEAFHQHTVVVSASDGNLSTTKAFSIDIGDVTEGAQVLTGRAGRDKLVGGRGNDKLLGKGGNDTLTGGDGRDGFVFDTRLRKTNVDKIIDFNAADDTIYLENTVFKSLKKAGFLSKGAFHVGARAHDASDKIIYNKQTGALYYDADGIGVAAQIKFAQLSPKLALTHQDFLVI